MTDSLGKQLMDFIDAEHLAETENHEAAYDWRSHAEPKINEWLVNKATTADITPSVVSEAIETAKKNAKEAPDAEPDA